MIRLTQENREAFYFIGETGLFKLNSFMSSKRGKKKIVHKMMKLKHVSYGLVQLCPARGPRAACGPVKGFVRPS